MSGRYYDRYGRTPKQQGRDRQAMWIGELRDAGMSNRAIARRVGISERSVRRQLERLALGKVAPRDLEVRQKVRREVRHFPSPGPETPQFPPQKTPHSAAIRVLPTEVS